MKKTTTIIDGELYVNTRSLAGYINWYSKDNDLKVHTNTRGIGHAIGNVQKNDDCYTPVSGIKAYIRRMESCEMKSPCYTTYMNRAKAFRAALEHYVDQHEEKLAKVREEFGGIIFPWAA